MMRYRYHTFDWKLIVGIVVVIAVVLLLLLNRTTEIRLSGPSQVAIKIKAQEQLVFNATIRSQPGSRSYSNYSWHADGRGIFEIEELSENFVGRYSRFPLESGETRKLRFRVTLIGENPPEGRYFIDFHLEAEEKGKAARISNVYRLWVELEREA